MGHLSEDQLGELRAELERQLAKLKRSITSTSEAARPVELDQTTVGRLSRMDSLQNQSLSKNLQEREEMRLALLRAALERMGRGEYGICQSCGAEVPFGRLWVVPESPSCADCG